MAVIALDVGGSSVKHGVVDLDHSREIAVQSMSIDSQGSASTIISTFSDVIQHYRQLHPAIKQIGFGFPGPFDYVGGVSYITGLEKYESLYKHNIRDLLADKLNITGIDIRFRNDAEAAIVGEAIYGQGSRCRRIIGITLGTGMGSAFIVDGESVTNGEGVPKNGWLYPMTFNGIRADDAFSTRGLLSRFEDAELHVGDDIARIDQSDKHVQEVLAQFGADLGNFLLPFAVSFHADCVIMLGGISQLFPLFGSKLTQALNTINVIKGTLDNKAALLGIAHLFR